MKIPPLPLPVMPHHTCAGGVLGESNGKSSAITNSLLYTNGNIVSNLFKLE